MQILGREISQAYLIAGAAGAIILGGAGISYVLYTFRNRRSIGPTKSTIIDEQGQEDISLPLALVHDFGNYQLICQKTDPLASAYLSQIPDSFFNFNQNLCDLASTHFTNRLTKFKNALVIGSGTGKLCIELSKTFKEVKGIEKSFSKVVNTYQFQNQKKVTYYFPLEGSHRTAKGTCNIEEPLSNFSYTPKRRLPYLENIEFAVAEPNRELSQLGEFQLVILPNSLNNLDDPEGLLARLNNFVVKDGILIISSDYTWRRTTNQNEGFGDFPVKTSFEYIKIILQDHFDLVEESYIPDVVGESLRSCRISNCHTTVWIRNAIPNVLNYTTDLDNL